MTEFEQIYREHFDTVYRFLIRLCRNEPLAEELAQETFFRALRSLSKFDGRRYAASPPLVRSIEVVSPKVLRVYDPAVFRIRSTDSRADRICAQK